MASCHGAAELLRISPINPPQSLRPFEHHSQGRDLRFQATVAEPRRQSKCPPSSISQDCDGQGPPSWTTTFGLPAPKFMPTEHRQLAWEFCGGLARGSCFLVQNVARRAGIAAQRFSLRFLPRPGYRVTITCQGQKTLLKGHKRTAKPACRKIDNGPDGHRAFSRLRIIERNASPTTPEIHGEPRRSAAGRPLGPPIPPSRAANKGPNSVRPRSKLRRLAVENNIRPHHPRGLSSPVRETGSESKKHDWTMNLGTTPAGSYSVRYREPRGADEFRPQ